MRLEHFDSTGKKPLGEGDDKRVFIDPENEKRVISEMKESAEKESPRALKGRYYLTKIVHLLLPQHIPDVYQTGESKSGVQNVDAAYVTHSESHTKLQDMRQSDQDESENEKMAAQEFANEMGDGVQNLVMKLEDIGLGFNIDDRNMSNFIKDKNGVVHYIETFKPWQVDDFGTTKEVDSLFDEEGLRSAIEGIADVDTRAQCVRLFERLMALEQEEEQELQSKSKPEALYESNVKEIENIFAQFADAETLARLHLISTAEEVAQSSERELAKNARALMLSNIQYLLEELKIPSEEYWRLQKMYITLSMAIGTINRGVVDHTR